MEILEQNFRFVICIEDRDSEDLEKGKVYRLLPDEAAGREGYLRIIENPRKTISIRSPISFFWICLKRHRKHLC